MDRITVAGAGYVGLSIATMLSISNKVTILHIDYKKIHVINNRKSPLVDEKIDYYFKKYDLDLNATQELGVSSTLASNKLRIDILVDDIKQRVSRNDTIGIYKLAMKKIQTIFVTVLRLP